MRKLGGFSRIAAVASAFVVAGGVTGMHAAAAAPVTLSCGAVVTTSIVLANDIGPCHEDGIIVGADNITVDLNGHQVFGEGGSVVIHQAAGVFSDNHTGVTITNGTVHDFYHGIRVRRGDHNRVTAVNAQDNVGGNGIVLESSADNLADHNTVYHNGRFSGISTFDTNSFPAGLAQRNTIADNVLYLNNGSIFGSPPSPGISIENGSGHAVLRNRVSASGRDGIQVVSGVRSVLIEGNQITGNGTNGINIRSGANNNTIRSNQTYQNVRVGILVSGQSNVITANASRGNGQFDLQDTNVNCDANSWTANVFGTATPTCAGGGAGA